MSNNDLATLVEYLFTALTIVVLGRALLSWFDPGMKTRVGRLLVELTEPLLAPIRRIMPSTGMFDLAPIVLIVLLQVISRVIVQAIR